MRLRKINIFLVCMLTIIKIITVVESKLNNEITSKPIKTEARLMRKPIENNAETVEIMTEEIIPEVVEQEIIYYDIPLSEELQKFTYETCQEYDIEYELALAVMQLESDFDINCVSYNKKNGKIISKDRGLFQINSVYEDWYAELAGLEKTGYDVFNPYDNIRMGIAGLAYFKERWKHIENVDERNIRMLNSYNAGEVGYKRYIKRTGKISRAYDKRIFEYRKKFYEKQNNNIDNEK